MTDKFQNKYRISSARKQDWDYGCNASYFITICTESRECFFGNVVDGKMQLSEMGEIAHQYWKEIPAHFPFIELGEFVVMPNHVHGIIIINKRGGIGGGLTDRDLNVETQNLASLHLNQFGPQSKNLASIIRGFKVGVKKYATMNHLDFGWQSRYYDHIIRNAGSYRIISEYIAANPQNWIKDFNNR